MKQEFEDSMKVGQKYPGYGVLNAFREFIFIPSQKGANEGKMQLVRQGKAWTIHATRENIVIHVKIPRKDKPLERIQAFLQQQNEIVEVLKEYDLSVKPKKPTKKK